MRLLGLDVGTTGCKAAVFDSRGTPHGTACREYGVVCTHPAMAEQDAEAVWRLVGETLREAVAASGAATIQGLSLSVQGDAVIPVDRSFRPLHPAILGMDYRAADQARWCEEVCGGWELFQATGMRPHPMNSLAKILWLRAERPRVFDQAWKVVTYADYLLGRLGAEAVIDLSMASRTMALDLQSAQWSGPILDRVGLTPTCLARPVPSGTPVGEMSPLIASSLGLPGRIPLVAGGHDQCCAALGAGLVDAGFGVVSTGTAEVLATAFAEPKLTRGMFEGFYPCYRHVVPGRFFTFSLNHVAGILLQWFRDGFCHADSVAAAAAGRSAYQMLDERLPEGPSPVMVLPHWNGSGTPWCDLASRGAIVGLTLATTRHDVFKAILEALCFELRVNLEVMARSGIQVDALVAVGGGAKSAVWLQLKADVLNRPIRALRCRESASLGAALLAGVGAGVYASCHEAARATVGVEKVWLPRAENAARYEERYQTYRRLYPALREFGEAP
jgi:sugar (pentulose or hexulose) kinase